MFQVDRLNQCHVSIRRVPLLITVYLKPGMSVAKGDALQALPTPVHSYSLGGASGYFYNTITCI